MAKLLSGLFATAAVALTLTTHAQLPTMSDVDHSTNKPVDGPLPKWDVASLKPHPPEDGMMSWRMNDDSLSLINLPLEQMICSAWDMKSYQVSGLTGWMKSAPWDLNAKISPEDIAAYKKLSGRQRSQMLQQLLIDRFQLKVHTETKVLPLYDLVIDKTGAKLTPTTAIEAPSREAAEADPEKYKKGEVTMGPGMFNGTGVSVRSLASQLDNALGKPVRDKTGLTGAYDIKLHYRPEDTANDSADTPSVFTAVQTLGLKLVPGKGPVETLVIDSAQKPEAD
jgi:uncharacterized protein (TIGR03435 family)